MINRESYIIGCFIQDKATHVFLPKIKSYWFEGWNKEIIEFMQLSYLNNNPIDLVSLARQFKGKAYELTQFTNSYAYSTDLKHYLFELDIEYKKTQLIEKLSGLNTLNTLDIILKDIDLITQEANITIDKEPLPMSKVTAKVVDDLEQQMQRGEKLMGITTGWRMLDKYIGGWNKGNLVIVAGRPGCFDGDQLIHTKRGLTKIKDINTNDYVLSYNEKRDINEWRKVLARPLHETTPDRMFKITLKDGTVIKVTENHEFFTGSAYMKIKDFLLPLLNENDLEKN